MNIEQITGACGAEISGVNLARLSNSEFVVLLSIGFTISSFSFVFKDDFLSKL